MCDCPFHGQARAAMMAVCSQPMRIEDVSRNLRGLNGRNTEVSPSLWDWEKFEYYLNSPRYCFIFIYSFLVSQVGAALMGDTAGTSRASRPKHVI